MIQRLKAELETKELFRIGRKAENEVEQFDFDFTTWQEKYGEGSAVLLVQRNRDDSAYPVPLIIENGIASWVITDTDTAKSGRGTFQLEYVSGTKKKKSDVWHFICGISLEGTLPAPDPYENWLETITEKTAEASGYAQNAQQSAQDAYQSAEDAEASAVSARSSAESASQSAQDLQDAVDSAQASATQAERSATSAQNRANDALRFAQNANASQRGAREAASEASASATEASTSATNAEASATASAASASEADASADRAEQAKEDILASRPNWEESDSESLSYISNKPSIKSGTGVGSIVEGLAAENSVSGDYSHAEGCETVAPARGAHAEGRQTTASHSYSHAEGNKTSATQQYAHAEGSGSTASGTGAHAEGSNTVAKGLYSHAEGMHTIASRRAQHVQGAFNIEDTEGTTYTNGKYLHIVGNGTDEDNRSNAHTLDWDGNAWYAGKVTADGTPTNDNDLVSKKWVEDKGYLTEQAQSDWTETDNTSASYVQNKPSIASGTGTDSVIEGCIAGTNANVASKNYSHAEGFKTEASGVYSHAEGTRTKSSSGASHSEGLDTIASGNCSHAESSGTKANGYASHSEGILTIASSTAQHVQGQYNIEDSNNTYAHIVGNGIANDARSNAHTLDWNGNAWYAGKVTSEGTPTESNDLVPKSYADKFLNAFPVDSASGSVASFSDGAALPLKALTVGIDPAQGLHGYDSPWPAGGGINMLDISTCTEGKRLDNVGNLVNGASYATSDWIPVEPNTDYCIRNAISASSGYAFCFYDSDKTFLRYAVLSGTAPINGVRNSGENAVYARVTVVLASIENSMLAKSSSIIDFSPYSNICPISGWTGANVVACGKNLFGGDAWFGVGGTDDRENRTVSGGSKASSLPYLALGLIGKYKSNTRYTLILTMTSTSTNGRPGFQFVYTDGTYSVMSVSGLDTTKKTFAIVSAANKTLLRIDRTSYSGTKTYYVDECGLFEGVLTADDFEEYHGTPITIDFGQTVYGGVLDVLSGKLTVDRAMVDMGTFEYYKSTSPQRFETAVAIENCKAPSLNSDVADILVDCYKTVSANTTSENSAIAMNTAGLLRIYDSGKYDSMSRHEFKTAMSGVQLLYPLITPIEIQLDPHEVSSLLGVNNIYADTGDTSVEYRADPTLYISKKIAEAISALT